MTRLHLHTPRGEVSFFLFPFLFPSLSRAIGLTSRSRFLHTADELEPAIGKHASDVDVLERKLEHAEAQSSRHKLAAIDAADKRETWCIEVSSFYLPYMGNWFDVFVLTQRWRCYEPSGRWRGTPASPRARRTERRGPRNRCVLCAHASCLPLRLPNSITSP